MDVIEGTTDPDVLYGTEFDDILKPYGTNSILNWDYVSGGDGADIYDLGWPIGQSSLHYYVIDDKGRDGGQDSIIGVGKLYYSASLGYQGWASAIRIGDDLFIDTPGKPHRFHDPAKPSFHLEIRDHYVGAAVETMVAGGVSYNLAAGDLGGSLADIVAGTDSADHLVAFGGDDWVFGNGGKDLLDLGSGDDTAFGGDGRDKIIAGAGDDIVFGGAAKDVIKGGAGDDQLYAEAGNDVIRAGSGADFITGGSGDDRILAGAGADWISGDAGDDWISGGKAGDLYRFSSGDSGESWGHDVIEDRGDKASYQNVDTIELSGFYGPSSGSVAEAIARISFGRVGEDMVLSADDGVSTITVSKMFDARVNKFFIEHISLNGAYWDPIVFMFVDGGTTDIGDDRDYPYGYKSKSNEVLFGTDQGEDIFGNTGHNFIWTGGGADVLIYKENDPVPFSGYSATISHDIVEDFDILLDRLDFTEMGIAIDDLVIDQDADGDATIYWASPISHEITSILIELRGVAMVDVTEDLFLF